jgi:HD-like signal output (HDOD) protein
MCAKILQLVNSAFFRLAWAVSRIEEAISYLGFNAVKHLALAVEVYREPSWRCNKGRASDFTLRRCMRRRRVYS